MVLRSTGSHCAPPVSLSSALQLATEFFIYTDGSFKCGPIDGIPRSSWGFVIVCEYEGCLRYVGAAGGRVSVLDEDGAAASYVGASHHAACMGEYSALMWALKFIAGASSSSRATFHVYVDALNQMRAAAGSGRWNASQLRFVRGLSLAVEQLAVVRYSHVFGHDSQPWNELADFVAKHFCEQFGPFVPRDPPRFPLDFFFAPAVADWLWMALSSVGDKAAFPTWCNDTLRITEYEPLGDMPLVSLPMELSQTIADPDPTDAASIQLRVASANVLTLDDLNAKKSLDRFCAGRVELLRHQFSERRYHIIGVQEAAANDVGAYISHGFMRLAQGGRRNYKFLELWINTTLPYAVDGDSKFCISQNACTVIDDGDGVMIVRILADLFSLDVVVAHAPHTGASHTVRDEWFTNLQTMVKTRRGAAKFPFIILIDGNATLGKTSCSRVGDHCADPDNANTPLFRRMLKQTGSFCPSTFAAWHSGIATTFTHSGGNQTRIDYIVTADSIRPYIVASFVDDAISLATVKDDHYVVGLDFVLPVKCNASRPHFPKLRIDHSKLKDVHTQEVISERLRALPLVPWQVDVDTHAAALVRDLRQILVEEIPMTRQAARKSFISASTLAHVHRQKLLRKDRFRHACVDKSSRRRAIIGEWFRAYKANIGILSIDQATPPEYLLATANLARILFCKSRLDCDKSSFALRKMLAVDKKAVITLKASSVKDAQDDRAFDLVWRTIKDLCPALNRKSSTKPLPAVTDKSGALVPSLYCALEQWGIHMASDEAGVAIDVPGIVRAARTARKASIALRSAPPLELLTTRLDIEQKFLSLKPGAPGHDAIPPVCFYKTFAADSARLFVPLALKTSSLASEPVQWQGGRHAKFYKGTGLVADKSNSRVIVCSDVCGKSLQSVVRLKSIDAAADFYGVSQFGDKRGGGVDFASHAVKSFQDYAEYKTKSSALFFVDVLKAYYSALRELILQYAPYDDAIPFAVRSLGLPDDIVGLVIEECRKPPALRQARVPDHAVLQLSAPYSASWFTVEDDPRLWHTHKGTKPGTPCADLIFNLLEARVTKALHDELAQQGLVEFVAWSGDNNYFLAPPTQDADQVAIPDVTFADDSVLMVMSPYAVELVPRLISVANVATAVYAKHGLILNMKKHKSAAILRFRGQGAQAAHKALHLQHSDGVPFDALGQLSKV